MEKPVKNGLSILGIIVLLCCVWAFCVYILPVLKTFHEWRQQMFAGQEYMDSLTERDFQIWADRTQLYLSQFDPDAHPIDAKPVPAELGHGVL